MSCPDDLPSFTGLLWILYPNTRSTMGSMNGQLTDRLLGWLCASTSTIQQNKNKTMQKYKSGLWTLLAFRWVVCLKSFVIVGFTPFLSAVGLSCACHPRFRLFHGCSLSLLSVHWKHQNVRVCNEYIGRLMTDHWNTLLLSKLIGVDNDTICFM